MKSNYIPSLDGLRAVSIIIVFISHVGFGHIVPGGFGVTVFFFLSGFLITSLLIQEFDTYGSVSIGAFYLRRVFRLAPPLLVTIAFAAALVLFGFAEGDLSIATFLSQIFFFFNYFSLYADSGNSVAGLGILWSLSVEEHFYLFYPVLFILIARGFLGLWSILAIIMVVTAWRFVCFLVLDMSMWEIYTRTDTRVDSMLYGCLLALLTRHTQIEKLMSDRYMYLFIAVGLILILFSFGYRDETFRSTARYTVQGIALLPLFYFAVRNPEALCFRPLNWSWVKLIGKYSYTIYLAHFVIIKSLVFMGFGVTGEPVFVVVAFTASMIYAALVFELAEKPFKTLRLRYSGH